MKRPKKWVRLECRGCCRIDWDGITQQQLDTLVKTKQVFGVREQQSYEAATDLEHNIGDWATHCCECRECMIEQYGEDFETEWLGEKQTTLF